MTLVSKLGAAEDALLALMLADSQLGTATPAVPVGMGDPGAGVRKAHVWISDEADAEWEPGVTMGPTPTEEETFDLRVVCLYARAGNDTTGLRDLVMALAASVCRIVADNRRLSNTVDDAYVTRVQRFGGATEGGRAMIVEVTVHCESTLA